MTDDKPELTLMPGDKMFDADAIIEFYTKLTGERPTDADIAELRQYLKDHLPGRT